MSVGAVRPRVFRARRVARNPSFTFAESINQANTTQAAARELQAVAAVHVNGFNTWPGACANVITRAGLVAQIAQTFGAGYAQSVVVTGITVKSNHKDCPLLIAFKDTINHSYQVVTGMGYVRFSKRLPILPGGGTTGFEQLLLASGLYTTYQVRVYYKLQVQRTI